MIFNSPFLPAHSSGNTDAFVGAEANFLYHEANLVDKNTKLFCKPEISESSEAAHTEITACMISISQNSASVTLQPL